MKRLDMNDPRLTTFALGELEGEEAIEIAKLVENDPAARKYVEEIRETAAMLTGEFQKELNSRENIPLRLMPDEREKIFAGSTAQPWWKKWQVMVPSAGLATLAVAVLAIVTRPEPQSFTEKVGTISESTDYTLEGSGALGAKTAMKVPPSSAAALDSYSQQAGAQVPAETQNSPKEDVMAVAPAPEASMLGAGAGSGAGMMAEDAPNVVHTKNQKPSAQASQLYRSKVDPKSGLSAMIGPEPTDAGMVPTQGDAAASNSDELADMSNTSVETSARLTAPKMAASDDAMNAPIVMKKGKDVDPGFGGQQQTAKSSETNTQNRGGMGTNIIESQWLRPQEFPVSKFWIDVGTASYAYVRQTLKGNELPLTYNVRTEELYNSFKYDYPQPRDQKPYSVTTEVAQSPFSPQNKIVRIGLQERANQNLESSNVNVEVAFDPQNVSSYRLIGFDRRFVGEQNSANGNAGKNSSGRAVTALYEVVPAGTGSHGAELMEVKLHYKTVTAKKNEVLEVSVPNNARSFEEASSDLKFASAVAAFGMHLRGSQTTGEMTYDRVIEVAAKNSKVSGKADRNRQEFVELARTAMRLSSRSNKNR